MARHRHIRMLDVNEVYEDFVFDDETPVEISPIAEETKDREHFMTPTKSLNFSDFIISSPRHSKLKRKKEFETDLPDSASVFNKPTCSNSKCDVDDERTLYKKRNCVAECSKSVYADVKQKLVYPSNDLCGDGSSASKNSTSNIDHNLQKAVEFYEKRNVDGKPVINLVVVGHVDTGKSTLMGSLLVSLGYVSDQTLSKYQKECRNLGKSSFAYAWVCDETSEERKRGTTMDVSQRMFDTVDNSIVVLDTPGHRDFVSNMISGASEADAAIIVLDASFGEFEAGFCGNGQTKEHLLLVKSLGISQLIAVVNKMDSVMWKQDRFLEIVNKISPFLKKVGFQNILFVPCSSLLGANLVKASDIAEFKDWYNGPTLLNAINELKAPKRQISEPFRFPISDIFKVMSKTLSVSGRIESGYIKVQNQIVIMPEKQVCTVSKIFLNDVNAEYAFAGDQVELQLSTGDSSLFTAGLVMCRPENLISVTSRFRAQIVVFDIVSPLTNGFPVTFHRHSYCEQAVIHKLVSTLNKSNGETLKKRPRFLLKNSCADVEILVAKPICLELYKDMKELGRFLLRSKGVSVAAGMVMKLLVD